MRVIFSIFAATQTTTATPSNLKNCTRGVISGRKNKGFAKILSTWWIELRFIFRTHRESKYQMKAKLWNSRISELFLFLHFGQKWWSKQFLCISIPFNGVCCCLLLNYYSCRLPCSVYTLGVNNLPSGYVLYIKTNRLSNLFLCFYCFFILRNN